MLSSLKPLFSNEWLVWPLDDFLTSKISQKFTVLPPFVSARVPRKTPTNPSLRMATRESSHFPLLQKKTVLSHSLKLYSPPKASTELTSTLMHTQR